MNYKEFLNKKLITDQPTGLVEKLDINPKLFDFQKDIVRWALKRGRSAIWADCGLGKSFMQLEWARHIPGDVLILAPLAVAPQTVREGEKLGIAVKYCRDMHDVNSGITITNYEMMDKFDPSFFTGIVLDESSILKSYTGKFRTQIIESFSQTPFRLACTATPAPNDYMELGNHAEFLGVMTRSEMLSMFFVHDGGDTSQWRLKGHAESEYWKWICSWAVMIRKPSDLGYEDKGFKLPPMNLHEHVVETDIRKEGQLFFIEAQTLQERRFARRDSILSRIKVAESVIIESWTKNKKVNTTELIESLIDSTYSKKEKNGIVKTLSENGNEAANLRLNTVNKGALPKKNIIQNMPKNGGHMLKNGVNVIPNGFVNIIKNAGHVQLETGQSAIGICEMNSEFPCLNMNQCLNDKVVDALSVEQKIVKAEDSLLTIATKPEQCAEYSALYATELSDNSKITRNSCAKLLTTLRPQWIVWCGLNSEQDELEKRLGNKCVSIFGSLDCDEKIRRFELFQNGDVPVLLTKASIFGYGINMQFSHHQIFLGISDSFESYYQAVRRQWRFGQKKPVNVHIITADIEGAVVKNIQRKEADAVRMAENMVKHMHSMNEQNIKGTSRQKTDYEPNKKMELPQWM